MNDLPSVGTEDARSLAELLKCGMGCGPTERKAATMLRALVSERDELASRVKELEAEVMDQCRLNGMGAERELALMGRVRELEAALKGLDEAYCRAGSPLTRDERFEDRKRLIAARAALSATTPESKP